MKQKTLQYNSCPLPEDPDIMFGKQAEGVWTYQWGIKENKKQIRLKVIIYDGGLDIYNPAPIAAENLNAELSRIESEMEILIKR